MTREEAIRRLKEYEQYAYGIWHNEEEDTKAFDMAIEALQTDVVRCGECTQKHIGGSVTQYNWCDLWDREVDGTDFCAWGERREP